MEPYHHFYVPPLRCHPVPILSRLLSSVLQIKRVNLFKWL